MSTMRGLFCLVTICFTANAEAQLKLTSCYARVTVFSECAMPSWESCSDSVYEAMKVLTGPQSPVRIVTTSSPVKNNVGRDVTIMYVMTVHEDPQIAVAQINFEKNQKFLENLKEARSKGNMSYNLVGCKTDPLALP